MQGGHLHTRAGADARRRVLLPNRGERCRHLQEIYVGSSRSTMSALWLLCGPPRRLSFTADLMPNARARVDQCHRLQRRSAVGHVQTYVAEILPRERSQASAAGENVPDSRLPCLLPVDDSLCPTASAMTSHRPKVEMAS